MKYLILTKNFHPKLNLVLKLSKRSFQSSNFFYLVQFNPLSYVACYVGTCCHIWSIIVNKNQQFYKFDCYKSFNLMKLNDEQFSDCSCCGADIVILLAKSISWCRGWDALIPSSNKKAVCAVWYLRTPNAEMNWFFYCILRLEVKTQELCFCVSAWLFSSICRSFFTTVPEHVFH